MDASSFKGLYVLLGGGPRQGSTGTWCSDIILISKERSHSIYLQVIWSEGVGPFEAFNAAVLGTFFQETYVHCECRKPHCKQCQSVIGSRAHSSTRC